MRITIRQGPNSGQIIVVDRALTLGRDADVDVTVNDALVSTRHATLSPNADGSVELTDLSSTNGTFVNDQRIEGSTTLRGGERIRIGKVILEVEGTLVGSGGAGTAVAAGRGGETRLAGAGAWKLIVSGGPSGGEIVDLAEGTQVIGRDAASDIVINDSEVSSRHASVTRSGSTVQLKDLGSLNGTKVNGEPITEARTLVPGDRISIGPATIQLDNGEASTRTVVRTAPVAAAAAPAAAKAAPIPSQPFQPGRVAPAAATKGRGVMSGKALAVIGAVVVAAAVVVAFVVTNDSGGDSKGATTAAATAAPTNTGPLTAKQLIDQNRDATVQVIAELPDVGNRGTGSGTVIDAKDGLLITNNHVAGAGSQLSVRKDGTSALVPVDLVAAAPCEDLALLRIRNPGDRAAFARQVTLGKSAGLAPGDQLVALGYPLEGDAADFAQIPLSATAGIVSKAATSGANPTVPLQSVIQHTAAINGGNSGGPLFNDRGEQVGVNTASDPNFNDVFLSIPSDRVAQLLPQLKTGWSPAWIGAELETAIDSKQQLVGVTVGNLVPFGPADQAKMLPGLIIVRVNRRPVTSLQDYCTQMPAQPGTPVIITTVDPQTGAQQDWNVTPGMKK